MPDATLVAFTSALEWRGYAQKRSQASWVWDPGSHYNGLVQFWFGVEGPGLEDNLSLGIRAPGGTAK